MKQTCRTCKFWMNKQAELGYNEFNGICVSTKLAYDNNNESDAMLLIRDDDTTGRFEHITDTIPVGDVRNSQYCLVTGQKYGCVNYQGEG